MLKHTNKTNIKFSPQQLNEKSRRYFEIPLILRVYCLPSSCLAVILLLFVYLQQTIRICICRKRKLLYHCLHDCCLCQRIHKNTTEKKTKKLWWMKLCSGSLCAMLLFVATSIKNSVFVIEFHCSTHIGHKLLMKLWQKISIFVRWVRDKQ